MASRLAVVLCSGMHGGGPRESLHDQLIADVLFTAGLDASIIQSLTRVEVASTDHLCLQGIMGDMALVGWDGAEVTAEQLKRLGVVGRMWWIEPTEGTVRETSLALAGVDNLHAKRNLFHFDLTVWDSAASVLDRLKTFLGNREVRVVPIQLGGLNSGGRASDRKVAEGVVSMPVVADRTGGKERPGVESGTGGELQRERLLKELSSGAVEVPGEDGEEDWSHLDRLVDDLDASSL